MRNPNPNSKCHIRNNQHPCNNCIIFCNMHNYGLIKYCIIFKRYKNVTSNSKLVEYEWNTSNVSKNCIWNDIKWCSVIYIYILFDSLMNALYLYSCLYLNHHHSICIQSSLTPFPIPWGEHVLKCMYSPKCHVTKITSIVD